MGSNARCNIIFILETKDLTFFSAGMRTRNADGEDFRYTTIYIGDIGEHILSGRVSGLV